MPFGPPFDRAALRYLLKPAEGWRRRPYRDTEGYLSIGCGRNLDAKGLHDDEIALLLENDITEAIGNLDQHLPWWRELDRVRQLVLAEMSFNLGIGDAQTGKGLLGFVNTLEHIRNGRWEQAADGMLASKWSKQVGARADRLAAMMRTGEAPT